MCTKSQRLSSFIRSILIFALILMISQALYSQSVLSGLGIEIGGGYNQMFLKDLLPPLKDFRFDRTQFALTPEVRLKYDIRLSDNFNCNPFLGYNRFGGESSKYSYGSSTIWFDALETGLFITYKVSVFSFGIGYKANRHLKIMDWMSTSPPIENSSFDVTNQYPSWSHDAGLRVSYRLSHFSISAESWFGISELVPDNELSQVNIHENHFRLLLGYTI